MNTHHIPTEAVSAAHTQTINLSAQPLGKTAGSLKWLLSQKITAKFYEPDLSYKANFPHRIALLTVGEYDIPVAADGAFLDERRKWVARDGYHSIPIQTNRFGLPILGVSLTTAARTQLEQLAEAIRCEFQDWLYDDTDNVEIPIKVISR